MEKEMKFCQSCGMPMEGPEAVYGTEANGEKSGDYCSYCYQNGAFTYDCGMEQMIDECIPHVVEACGSTPEEARRQMEQFFPALKRWKA